MPCFTQCFQELLSAVSEVLISQILPSLQSLQNKCDINKYTYK